MSKQKPSQGFHFKFEHHWGGKDTWYTKGKRWANKQKFPINHLALGFLEWLWQHWIDGKVKLTMTDVDKQAEEIVKSWEGEDGEQWDVVEEGVFGDEGWSISATNKAFDRGSEETD